MSPAAEFHGRPAAKTSTSGIVDVRINVLILSMAHEIEVLLKTVDSLLLGPLENVTISILLNGARNDELRSRLERFPFVRYYESPANLGVAGGRNFLCSTDESKTADLICILDNDVIAPRDYLDGIAQALLADAGVGVVGAAVADIKRYYQALERFQCKGRGAGAEIYDLTSREVKAFFLADPSPAALYHIGAHRNWFVTYLTPVPMLYALINKAFARFGLRRRLSCFLKDDTHYIERIVRGASKFEVSNIAGCSQSFRRSLLNQIGNFDSLFSPYGLEDVDFNVRAMKAGYKNFTLCDVWLLHGTDSRHKQRSPEKTVENFYRVLTIFAYKHMPHFLAGRLVRFKIWSNRLLLRLLGHGGAEAQCAAQRRGFSVGLDQLGRDARLTRAGAREATHNSRRVAWPRSE